MGKISLVDSQCNSFLLRNNISTRKMGLLRASSEPRCMLFLQCLT